MRPRRTGPSRATKRREGRRWPRVASWTTSSSALASSNFLSLVPIGGRAHRPPLQGRDRRYAATTWSVIEVGALQWSWFTPVSSIDSVPVYATEPPLAARTCVPPVTEPVKWKSAPRHEASLVVTPVVG